MSNRLSKEERLRRIKAFATLFSDWTASSTTEISKVTGLNPTQLVILIRNGLVERRLTTLDEDRSKGYQYEYKYCGEIPPNLKTAQKLAELEKQYSTSHKKSESTSEELIDVIIFPIEDATLMLPWLHERISMLTTELTSCTPGTEDFKRSIVQLDGYNKTFEKISNYQCS